MKTRIIFLFIAMAAVLAACSAADDPKQIAAFPQEAPIATYPRSPETLVIYHATLDLEVNDVERAAERAKAIAFELNGYLVSAQSWYQEGDKHTTVVLAVPASHFETARGDLLRLGSLAGEWVSSEPVTPGTQPWENYSQITIYLHPQEGGLPHISLPKWRPLRTLERAWDVFLAIFGFLLDVVIWVTVVAGPFILIGWGIRKLIRRWQQSAPKGKT